MMREQILAMRRAGMEPEAIAGAMGVEPEVVLVALEAKGGSAVLRKEARRSLDITSPDEEDEEDVTREDAREMLGIIKGIAKDEGNDTHARLNAAKYIHGVHAGYHRRHLDLNVNGGNLLLKINEAYADAGARARAALQRPAPPINVTPKDENASNNA